MEGRREQRSGSNDMIGSVEKHVSSGECLGRSVRGQTHTGDKDGPKSDYGSRILDDPG